MQTFMVFILLSQDNKLALGSICSTREEADAKLLAEFPKGYVIYQGYRVVEAELKIK